MQNVNCFIELYGMNVFVFRESEIIVVVDECVDSSRDDRDNTTCVCTHMP